VYLWINLSNKAKIVGFIWLGLGVIYLAGLTRGFRNPPRTLKI
jgi:hypothetical protein